MNGTIMSSCPRSCTMTMASICHHQHGPAEPARLRGRLGEAGADDLPGVSETARDIVLALQSPEAEAKARFIADRLHTLAAAAALARSAPSQITEAYALTQLAQSAWMPGASDLGEALKPLLDPDFVTM
jgi:hypothetical protein